MNRREFNRNLAVTALGSVIAQSSGSATAQGEIRKVTEGVDQEAPFRLSVMLWTVFRDLPFEQRLEKVAEAGYKYVELVGEYEKWSEDDFTRANAKRRDLGITFDSTAGLKHGVSNPSDREALLTDLRDALVAMLRLECPSIILLSGDRVPGMTRETQHQSCIDGLKAAAKVVQGKSIAGRPVQLLLETIDPEENPKYFLTSAAEAFEIVKTVNHPQVKFLYDFFHEQIAEGNLIEKLEKNIEHVEIVHIADVPGRHEPGTGEINYQSIFRKLAELRFDGVAAMEFLPTGDPVTQLRDAREMALRCCQGT
ncbi:MAG: hydroxypyruvate isomerase family protein [Terriglobales bacterium]